MTETTANIAICRFTQGVLKRQTMAVTHAPTPKKKMKNPGVISSKRKQAKHKMNQKTSGLEKVSVIITVVFKFK
jgi:hypothetical protein